MTDNMIEIWVKQKMKKVKQIMTKHNKITERIVEKICYGLRHTFALQQITQDSRSLLQ